MSILVTWMGWDGFQAFSTISFTTKGMKLLGDIIFLMRESSLWFCWLILGRSGSWLSAQLQDSVLAMSSSTDDDGMRWSAIRDEGTGSSK